AMQRTKRRAQSGAISSASRSMVELERWRIQEGPDEVLGADDARVGRDSQVVDRLLQADQLLVLAADVTFQLGFLLRRALVGLRRDDLQDRLGQALER